MEMANLGCWCGAQPWTDAQEQGSWSWKEAQSLGWRGRALEVLLEVAPVLSWACCAQLLLSQPLLQAGHSSLPPPWPSATPQWVHPWVPWGGRDLGAEVASGQMTPGRSCVSHLQLWERGKPPSQLHPHRGLGLLWALWGQQGLSSSLQSQQDLQHWEPWSEKAKQRPQWMSAESHVQGRRTGHFSSPR